MLQAAITSLSKVSDPELAEVWGQPRDEEAIELKLRTVEGKEATCRPHSGESRKFHSTFGIADGSPLGRCGLAFRQIHSDLPVYTLHPTLSTITTEPAPGSCDCGGAEWDWRCHNPSTDPLGGLGCMGCGVQECRFVAFLKVKFPESSRHHHDLQGLRWRPLPSLYWNQ